MMLVTSAFNLQHAVSDLDVALLQGISCCRAGPREDTGGGGGWGGFESRIRPPYPQRVVKVD